MELGLPGRSPVWGQKLLWWFCCAVFPTAGAAAEMSHSHATLGVSVPHVFYTCPEGATAKLVCTQKGAPMHSTDYLKTKWLFTPDIAQHCSGRVGPRHSIVDGHTHDTHGLRYGSAENSFWVILQNVTHEDQGRYCCVVLDFQIDHKHGRLVQRPHNHVLLQVTSRTNGSQECTVLDPKAPGGSAPVALAIAACILALLSLPLILVLVYKQRQNAQSSRRAQELVRMDSEAYGHENPVFLGGSPQTKTRTVSQIMTRQSSETGRHLLSEPGTPLSPPAQGDVFFPREDTIPESPPFLQL